MTITDEMIEAALDEWFADPNWRETFKDGPNIREYMKKSLKAAFAKSYYGKKEEEYDNVYDW